MRCSPSWTIFFAEGLENRYARHKKLAQMTRDWAAKHGFTLFPEKGFESVTLTCVSNGAQARRPRRGRGEVAKARRKTRAS